MVSPASGAITTVSTVDPIEVYFTASEQEYLNFARRYPTAEKRQAKIRTLELELILADGVTYPHKGRFFFASWRVSGARESRRLTDRRVSLPENVPSRRSRSFRSHRHQPSRWRADQGCRHPASTAVRTTSSQHSRHMGRWEVDQELRVHRGQGNRESETDV